MLQPVFVIIFVQKELYHLQHELLTNKQLSTSHVIYIEVTACYKNSLFDLCGAFLQLDYRCIWNESSIGGKSSLIKITADQCLNDGGFMAKQARLRLHHLLNSSADF